MKIIVNCLITLIIWWILFRFCGFIGILIWGTTLPYVIIYLASLDDT